MERVLLSWSGGKESAHALYTLEKTGYTVCALLTTVTEDDDRISMHGVRRVLLELQAESVGIPLDIAVISRNISNKDYESTMRDVLQKYVDAGVLSVAFGDIHLGDIRKYREDNLSKIGMRGVFPLWGRGTASLARAFVQEGFRAVVTCVDGQVLGKGFVGREFDAQFLSDLPSSVDPCGENGEFHSFVYDGPIFSRGIPYTRGEVVLREERFYSCDLIPAESR